MRFGLVLLALLTALPAFGRESEARRQYERGSIAYNLQRYDEALRHFQAAYELRPAPELLFNIAQCQRKLGQRAAAAASYRAYLREFPDAPNREQAAHFVVEMTAPAIPAPSPAVSEPAASPAPTIAAQPVLVASPPPSPLEKPWYRKPAGWTLLGVGVALGITSGTLLGYGNSLDGRVRSSNSLATAVQLQHDRDIYENTGWALLGIGAAGVVTGTVVLTIDALRIRRHSVYSRVEPRRD